MNGFDWDRVCCKQAIVALTIEMGSRYVLQRFTEISQAREPGTVIK